MNGILLIDKKENKSTTFIDMIVKKRIGTSKVGHAGTLDPFATGLVICGVNKGTKILSYLENASKEYLATLKLGIKTNTLDREGEVLERREVKKHNKEEIEEVLRSFLGKIKQVPPMYSALKVNGVPLYKLARKDVEIERKEREVEIYDIKLISYENDEITFLTHVSKGTYIRTLGEDIAYRLGELGHLVSLRRTRVGRFKVEDSKDVDIISCDDIVRIKDAVEFKKVEVDAKIEKLVRNGHKIKLPCEEKVVLLISKSGEELALYGYEDGLYKCLRGL